MILQRTVKTYNFVQVSQEDIKRQTTEINSVFGLCEVLKKNNDVYAFNYEAKKANCCIKSLEDRWKSICENSHEKNFK